MANDLNLRGRFDLDAGPAERTLAAVSARMRTLSDNSRTTNKTLSEQSKIIDTLTKAANAERKSIQGTLAAQQELNKARAQVYKIRSSARDATDLNQAKIDEMQILGIKKQQTEEERKEGQVQRNEAAAALADQRLLEVAERRGHAAKNAAGQQELNQRRKATEETRALMVIQRQADASKLNSLRMQAVQQQMALRAEQAMVSARSASLGQLSSMRYAIYDVSRGAALAGAGLTALGIAPIAMAVSWQAAFADVVRTSGAAGDQVAYLKAQFIDLVQTLPVSFEKLAEIGTLAGQLGIAKGLLTDFTSVVAKFSATSDVSVNDAATAFGRLASLIPDAKNFTAVADSVLKVGVNSAATEGQILKVATQISSLTGAAGMGYQATVGLAGALASVAVPPELSRGVITRVFGTISRAIGEGGIKLEQFGDLAGMSGKQFAASWGDESKVSDTFLALMQGIMKEGGNAEAVLRELGITSVRDVPVLLRLANAAGELGTKGSLVAQTFKDAANAAGELQKQYQIISNTSGAKIQVLFQNIQAALDAIGSSSLGPLSDILDGAIKGVRDFTDSLDETIKLFDIFDTKVTYGGFAGFATVALGIVGVLGLVVAALGQVAGGMLAMKTVMLDLRGTKVAETFFSLGDAIRGTGAASVSAVPLFSSTGAALGRTATMAHKGRAAFTALSGAVYSVTRAMAPLLAIGAAVGFMNWAIEADKVTTDMDEYTVAMTKASKVTETFLSIERKDSGAMLGFGEGTEKVFDSMKNFKVGLRDLNTEGGFWADTWQRIQQGFTTSPFASEAEKINNLNFDNTIAAINAFDDAYQGMVDAGNQMAAFSAVQELFKSFSGNDIDMFLSRSDAVKDSLESWLVLHGLDVTRENLEALARGTLPAYVEEMSSVLNIQEETIAAFEDSPEAVSAFMSAIDEGSKTFFSLSEAYGKAAEEQKKWAEAQAEATESSSDTWEDYYNEQNVSLDSFLAARQEQLDAQLEWAANLDTLLGQMNAEGVDIDITKGIIEELGAAGAEAAPLLEKLVNGTPEQRALYAEQAKQIGLATGGEFSAGLADAMGQAINQVAAQTALITQTGNAAGSALIEGLRASVAPENLTSALTGFNQHFATLPKTAQDAIIKGFEDGSMTLEDLVNNYDFEIDLTATTVDAEGSITRVNGIAEGLRPSFPVDAKTGPADGKINTVHKNAEKGKSFDIDANTSPAKKAWSLFRDGLPSVVSIAINAVASLAGGGKGPHDGGYINNLGQYRGYRKGGFTGAGGEWQEAGPVHKGEFVMTKKATERIGVQNLYDLMNHAQRGYQSGGAVAPVTQATSYNSYATTSSAAAVSTVLATMDAQSIQALANAIANSPTFLYTTDRLIAESASRGSQELTQIGSR